MSITSVNRREFLKVGAAGFAAAVTSGCGPKKELRYRFRGLTILEMFEKRAVLHVIDSDILGIHPHRPGPADPEVRSDLGATNLAPSRKNEEYTSKETWEWDLKGKQVRFHEQEPSSE